LAFVLMAGQHDAPACTLGGIYDGDLKNLRQRDICYHVVLMLAAEQRNARADNDYFITEDQNKPKPVPDLTR
jgi:hypothetical protein